jgi:hypothetical protein
MMFGILLAMLAFVVAYSSVPAVKANTVRMSSVRRTFEEQELLLQHSHQIVTIHLSGYIFFGSALGILNDVKKHVILSDSGGGINLAKLLMEMSGHHDSHDESLAIEDVGDPQDGDDVEAGEGHRYKACSSKEIDLDREDSFEDNDEDNDASNVDGQTPTSTDPPTSSRIWSATSWLWSNTTSDNNKINNGQSPSVLTPPDSERTRLNRAQSADNRDYRSMTPMMMSQQQNRNRTRSSNDVNVNSPSSSINSSNNSKTPVSPSIKSFYDLSSKQKNNVCLQWAQVRLRDLNRQPSFTSVMNSYIDVDSIGVDNAADKSRSSSDKGAGNLGIAMTNTSNNGHANTPTSSGNNNKKQTVPSLALGQRRFTESAASRNGNKNKSAVLSPLGPALNLPALTNPSIASPQAAIVAPAPNVSTDSADSVEFSADTQELPSMFQSLWQAQETNSRLANVLDKYSASTSSAVGGQNKSITKLAVRSPLFSNRNNTSSADLSASATTSNESSSANPSYPLARSGSNTSKDVRSGSMGSGGSSNPNATSSTTGRSNDSSDNTSADSKPVRSGSMNSAGSGTDDDDSANARQAQQSAHAAGDTDEDPLATKYLVLDFNRVLGVDATAMRTCFLMLVQLMRASEIIIIFTELNDAIESLLRAHGVLRADDVVIPKLDDALEWCEEQVLTYARSVRSSSGKQVSAKPVCPRAAHPLTYFTSAPIRRKQFVDQIPGIHGQDSSPTVHNNAMATPVPPPKSLRRLRHILEDYLELRRGQNHPV